MKFMLLCIIVGVLFYASGNEINEALADTSIKDPTYQEMVQFVGSDLTDRNQYDFDNYVCHDFTNDVLDNAYKQKIRAGYVYIKSSLGHAIVCFETTDKGLYFLEPQLDIIFDEAEMNTMVKNGWYSISDTSYYFSNSIYGYEIESWNNYRFKWKEEK